MLDQNDISIGVVVPAHRSSETISATLDAIVAQTVAVADAIVVLDGPDDATEAAVRAHPSGIESTILAENTGGPAAPRNAGAARLLARGSIDAIWFLDADDVPDPRFVSVVRDLARRHPEVDLLATGFEPWFAGDPPPPADDAVDRPADRVDLDWYLEHTGSMLPSFSVLRTRILDRLRSERVPFSTHLRINQDFDAFVRAIHLGKAMRTTWSGGAYRIHDSGISADGAATWICRMLADEELVDWFATRGHDGLASQFRRASRSASRSAARHLWRRRRSGDRATAIRLLLDDLPEGLDVNSVALLVGLLLGVDRRVRAIPVGDVRTRS